jgi:hypothetical protein
MDKQLKYLLEEKHGLEWEVIRFLKRWVNDYHTITAEDFLNLFTVRQMLKWPMMGLITVTKLAEALEKEGLYLRF